MESTKTQRQKYHKNLFIIDKLYRRVIVCVNVTTVLFVQVLIR